MSDIEKNRKLIVSNHNQIHKIEKDSYLLINPFSGALDVVDQEVVNLVKYIQNHSQLPSELNDDNQIVSLLVKRGYFLNRVNEEKKKAKALEKAIQKNFQPAFIIVPTYDCNFRCPYCYEQTLRQKPKSFLKKVLSEVQVDSIFQAMDDIDDKFTQSFEGECRKPTNVLLYGGEPLLPQNRQIVELIGSKVLERDWTISAITNGYHLEEFLPTLRKNNLSYLQITLDGPKEIHNSRRYLKGRKTTFDKIVTGIEKATKNGVFVNLRMNVDTKNMEYIQEFLDFCHKKGWSKPGSHVATVFGLVSTHSCKNTSSFSPLEYYRKLHEILKDSPEFTDAISNYIGILKPQLQYDPSLGDQINYPRIYYCGANTSQRIFDPHGYIYPCWGLVGDPKKAIGKYDQSGYEIFDSEFKKWNRSVLDLPKCSECTYALICTGGCSFNAITNDGEQDNGYCEQFPEIFEEFVPRHIIARMKDKNSPWYCEEAPTSA